eukprot:4399564-Prymnesium_polylepis.1
MLPGLEPFAFGFDNVVLCYPIDGGSGRRVTAGARSCDVCAADYYLKDLSLSPSTPGACVACPAAYACPWNSTLRTIWLQPGYWRLSDATSDVQACPGTMLNGSSTCIGGGHDGVCHAGYAGPLCGSCTQAGFYYERETGRCAACPGNERIAAVVSSFAAACVLVGGVVWLHGTTRPRFRSASLRLQRRAVWLRGVAADIGLVPKCKILLSFYQVATVLDSTYGLRLPDAYYDWMRAVTWLGAIDWAAFFLPPACWLSTRAKLAVGALAPLALIVLLILGGTLYRWVAAL